MCQSRDEIIAILNEDGDDPGAPADTPVNPSSNLLTDDNFSLARVKLALKYEQKRVSISLLFVQEEKAFFKMYLKVFILCRKTTFHR